MYIPKITIRHSLLTTHGSVKQLLDFWRCHGCWKKKNYNPCLQNLNMLFPLFSQMIFI